MAFSSRFLQVSQAFQKVQDHITQFLGQKGEKLPLVDLWTYEKGDGGGESRVWDNGEILEKGGVNFSAIGGKSLPKAALNAHSMPDQSFAATGVSLVFHPHHPYIPTIHMNIRYFEAGENWWFGGGIDLTPTYPVLSDIVNFHQKLKAVCDKHTENYALYKKQCDEYFYLPHRCETRGVGGVFIENLKGNFEAQLAFICDLGASLTDLYAPFIDQYRSLAFTESERDFCLYRRSRYVEFNLLFDRGTHFGIQSEGRTESILMSMPAVAHWKYNFKPEPNSQEAQLEFFLKPQDWLSPQIANLYEKETKR